MLEASPDEMQNKLDRRIAELEDVVAEQLAEQNVLGLWLQALTLATPDREAAAALFDLAVSSYRTKAGDRGFDEAHPPQLLADLLERMEPRIERVRAALRS